MEGSDALGDDLGLDQNLFQQTLSCSLGNGTSNQFRCHNWLGNAPFIDGFLDLFICSLQPKAVVAYVYGLFGGGLMVVVFFLG